MINSVGVQRSIKEQSPRRWQHVDSQLPKKSSRAFRCRNDKANSQPYNITRVWFTCRLMKQPNHGNEPRGTSRFHKNSGEEHVCSTPEAQHDLISKPLISPVFMFVFGYEVSVIRGCCVNLPPATKQLTQRYRPLFIWIEHDFDTNYSKIQ